MGSEDYRWSDEAGGFVHRVTGEPWVSPFAAPMIISDIPPYRSPITGEVIGGRRARADDLKRHNCVDANELGPPVGTLKNRKFAKKYGMEHLLSEESR